MIKRQDWWTSFEDAKPPKKIPKGKILVLGYTNDWNEPTCWLLAAKPKTNFVCQVYDLV